MVDGVERMRVEHRGLLDMAGAEPDLKNIQLDIRVQSPDSETILKCMPPTLHPRSRNFMRRPHMLGPWDLRSWPGMGPEGRLCPSTIRCLGYREFCASIAVS